MVKGPVSEKVILDLLLRRILEPESQIQDSKSGLWIRIRDVSTIMEQVHSPQIVLTHKEPNPDYFDPESNEVALFYNLSTPAFILLSIWSMGLFHFYWIIRNCIYLENVARSKTKWGLWGILKEVFALGDLLDRIKRDEKMNQFIKADFNPALTAWMWYGTLVLSVVRTFGWLRLSISFFIFDLITLAIVGLSTSALLPAHRYIRRVNLRINNPPSHMTRFFIVVILWGVFHWLIKLIIYLVK